MDRAVTASATYFAVNRPCEEALDELARAYNKLADEVERLWQLEQAFRELYELRFQSWSATEEELWISALGITVDDKTPS